MVIEVKTMQICDESFRRDLTDKEIMDQLEKNDLAE